MLTDVTEEEHREEVRYVNDGYKSVDHRNMAVTTKVILCSPANVFTSVQYGLFIDENQNIKLDFMNLTKDIFDSEILEVNFERAELVLNMVNSWIGMVQEHGYSGNKYSAQPFIL